MAKKYYSSNSAMAWKILALFLAIVLVAGTVTGIVFWQKGNIEFHPIGQEEVQESEEATGGATISDGTGNGISVKSTQIRAEEFSDYGVSALAESAYTLTVTVLPSGAGDTSVDYEVQFVNSSSTWAQGKKVSDYITVTPESDGALVATVECLQDFGEQIEIVVTSRDNPDASATCTCDYSKKVESVVIEFEKGDSTSHDFTLSADSTSYTFQEGDNFAEIASISCVYSDYTVDDTFTVSINANGNGGVLIGTDLSGKGYTSGSHNGLEIGDTINLGRNSVSYAFVYRNGMTGLNDFLNFFSENLTQAVYSFAVTASGTNSTYRISYPLYFSAETVKLAVNSISLDNDSFLF